MWNVSFIKRGKETEFITKWVWVENIGSLTLDVIISENN